MGVTTAVARVMVRDDAAIVADARAGMDVRLAAAGRMLALPDAEARAAVLPLLDARGDASATGAATVVLRAIGDVGSAPAWLAEPLERLAREPGSGEAERERRGLAVAALGSVRTRGAAKALVNLAAAGNGEAAGAFRALARLSGREDLGYDANKWGEWWTAVEFLPDAEWERQLSVGLAGRADAAVRERDEATARLLETLRKRYQASTSIDERSALLEEFLKDTLSPVRRFGLQLALQELANARTPGENVARAAVPVLRDPSPEFRRLAADALNVLASKDQAGALHQALVFETDPGVAASLMRSVARWPEVGGEGSKATVLRWLEAGEGNDVVEAPALDAVSAMLDAGMLSDPIDRSRVLEVVRKSRAESLPASGLRLMFVLGDDADAQRVIGLLGSSDAAVRQHAADALSRDGRGLDALLRAAMTDPTLFAIAARSVKEHRATAAGYQAVAALPAPTGGGSPNGGKDERTQQLLLIAEKLSPGELLAVARSTRDLELRERLLARLTSEPLETLFLPAGGVGGMGGIGGVGGMGGKPGSVAVIGTGLGSGAGGGGGGRIEESPHPEMIAGLLLLAQTRLELGRPGAALKALDALEPVRRFVDPALGDSMRTVTLLLLGRVDEAAKLQGTAEAWVVGLEESLDERHAMAVVREIERRWGAKAEKMPPQLAARVAAAQTGASAFVGPTTDVPR